MIVVDVNIIAYLLIQGDKTVLAQTLFRQDPDWQVPALWQHEFLNILATYVRAGGGQLADVQWLWQVARQLFGPATHDVQMEQALHLATAHTVSAYDAQYVVLAQTLAIPLVSEDQRLQRAFSTTVQSLQQCCARG
jgi:predicted nucleic acid-binding protein